MRSDTGQGSPIPSGSVACPAYQGTARTRGVTKSAFAYHETGSFIGRDAFLSFLSTGGILTKICIYFKFCYFIFSVQFGLLFAADCEQDAPPDADQSRGRIC
jgi:hypothetical protein